MIVALWSCGVWAGLIRPTPYSCLAMVSRDQLTDGKMSFITVWCPITRGNDKRNLAAALRLIYAYSWKLLVCCLCHVHLLTEGHVVG